MDTALFPLQLCGLLVMLTLLVEVLNWLFVYRVSEYKSLVNQMMNLHKQIAAMEEEARGKGATSIDKRKKKLEDSLTQCGVRVHFLRIRTFVVNVVVLGVAWRWLATTYKGKGVARLPFHPPAFIRRVSHLGLEDEDFYNCSVNFLFMLFSAGMRVSITKVLGLGPNRAVQHATNPMARMLENAGKKQA